MNTILKYATIGTVVICGLYAISAVESKHAAKWQGFCVHPLISDGMPFPLSPKDKFENGKLFNSDGTSYAIGVQCIFVKDEKLQANQ